MTGSGAGEHSGTTLQSSSTGDRTTDHETTMDAATTRLEPSTSEGETTAGDPCRAYEALATPAELESTPRADTVLERLALEVSGTFVASEAVYQRIVIDAAAVLEDSSHVIGAFHPVAGWRAIEVLFTEEGYGAVKRGEYDAWSCLHESYGPVELVLADEAQGPDDRWVALMFTAGNYALPMLVPFYESLPEVVAVRARPLLPTDLDLCAEIHDDSVYYISAHHPDCEFGGCPALVYEGFQTEAPGESTYLGLWSVEDGDPPRWYLDLEGCRQWLQLGETWPP